MENNGKKLNELETKLVKELATLTVNFSKLSNKVEQNLKKEGK